MNVYARIIVDEARRRGVAVEVLDDARNLFRLSHGGRSIRCHESLSDLTTAVAYEICADKRLTADVLRAAGLRVPRQAPVADRETARHTLGAWGALVVKPAVGEQGRGVTVDVRDPETLDRAIESAREWCGDVVLEEYVEGRDLRIIVIAHCYVAAIERVPAAVTGDGTRSVAALVAERNRELARTSGGESQIPLDDETRRAARLAGFAWDGVVPAGVRIPVRKTANYHTGGTIRDVTVRVSPALRGVAVAASRAIGIPMVGLDLVVPDVGGEAYVILEANERAGLANHEPQPTAERFVDLLFPETA